MHDDYHLKLSLPQLVLSLKHVSDEKYTDTHRFLGQRFECH